MKPDGSSPAIYRDMDKCVMCQRCVSVCDQAQDMVWWDDEESWLCVLVAAFSLPSPSARVVSKPLLVCISYLLSPISMPSPAPLSADSTHIYTHTHTHLYTHTHTSTTEHPGRCRPRRARGHQDLQRRAPGRNGYVFFERVAHV